MSKKVQILQAATECFTTYGYDKTSMSDIGKKVGLNKASLYYHYKDKIALFDAMIQTKRQAHRQVLRKELDEQPLGIPQIITFLSMEINFTEEIAVNFLAPASRHMGGIDARDQVFNTIVEEDLRLLQSMIQAAKGEGLFSQIEPVDLAFLILQTCRGLLLIDSPPDKPLDQRGEAYEKVRQNIERTISLLLKGAGG